VINLFTFSFFNYEETRLLKVSNSERTLKHDQHLRLCTEECLSVSKALASKP